MNLKLSKQKILKFVYISEADVMFPLLSVYLEDALAKLSKIYDFKPEGPILFELFPEQNDFSVRAIGLSMLPASGVCFGKVVAQISPRAVPLNTMNWASVAWHEFTHVFTLQMTNFNVPRWFTEGLSEMSERDRNPAVLRKMDDHLLTAYHAGLMRGIADLNAGFTRPRYGLEVVVCYYQAGLICHYISKTFGFNAIKDMLKLYKEGKKDEQVIREALGLEPEEFDKHFLAWLDENIFGKMNVLPPIPSSQIEDLKDRIMEDPEDLEAMEKLCIAYFKANKLRDAEINAGYLLALDPMNVSGYIVLGLTYYYQKNMERSLQFLNQAVELGSKDFHVYLTLGIIYYNQKNVKEAEKYFLLAKESYPSFVAQNNPYLLLANIYKATNQKQKYLQEIEEFLGKQGDNFPMRIELADEYTKQGKYKTAKKWLDEAQDIFPFDLDLQLKRIDVLSKLKDFKEAAVACDLALALKPEKDVVELHIQAADFYLKVDDKENAKKHAQEALKLEPNNRKAERILKKIE